MKKKTFIFILFILFLKIFPEKIEIIFNDNFYNPDFTILKTVENSYGVNLPSFILISKKFYS